MANPEPSRKVEKRSYPQLYINQVEFRYGNVQLYIVISLLVYRIRTMKIYDKCLHLYKIIEEWILVVIKR